MGVDYCDINAHPIPADWAQFRAPNGRVVLARSPGTTLEVQSEIGNPIPMPNIQAAWDYANQLIPLIKGDLLRIPKIEGDLATLIVRVDGTEIPEHPGLSPPAPYQFRGHILADTIGHRIRLQQEKGVVTRVEDLDTPRDYFALPEPVEEA